MSTHDRVVEPLDAARASRRRPRFSASSISSTIVRTRRVFDALTSTNASVIEMMSPTSRTTMSSPFLSSAACGGDPGSAARQASETASRAGVKRRSLRDVISRQCRGRAARMVRTTAGGHQPVDRAAARARRSRRSVEAMSRRGIATRSHPPARARRLGVRVAGPFDHHDRGEVAGLLEPPPRPHVGDRVGAEHAGTARGPGAASASSVSAVTDGRVALDLDGRRLDPLDAVDRGVDQREAVGAPTPPPGPASATDHRPRRAAPGRGRARRGPRSPRPRGRRAPGRRCRRTRRRAPAARHRHRRGVYGRARRPSSPRRNIRVIMPRSHRCP